MARRPFKLTDAIVEEICDRLSKGEPMAQICRDERMPSDRAVRYAQEERPDVASAIARAREAGFDYIAADCLDIADDKSGDPQRDRLRVDTRLKLLAKWDPKRYGDAVQMKHTDADGGPVQQVMRWAQSSNEATPDPSKL